METYIDKVYKLVQEATGLKSKETIKMYSLLVLTKGENITLSDIHDGWSMVMNFKEANPPYCYGHEHKSLAPFGELSPETQMRDEKYLEALKQVANKISFLLGDKNGTHYFKSKESAQAAIDKIGKDRLKKYYFCILEE